MHPMTQQPFTAGQVWSYRTRPQESGSTLHILKVDSVGGEPVYHLRVDGLSLPNRHVDGSVQTVMEHLPVSQAALEASALELLREEPLPAQMPAGYAVWQRDHQSGNGGVFVEPLDKVLSDLEEIFRGL